MLGYACEAEVWGETVLESLPKWPWVGRDPKFREHTRFQSGDPDAAFVRAELGEVELHDEIFATRKGSRFVLEGENDLLVKGSAIPAHSQEMRDEYVRHDSWVLSLQKGTVARQVRSRPEITRLAPGQKRLLNESAKAYPKAVPLITNAKQANLIAEAVERFAAIKFLHIESDYWAEGWIGDWVSRPPVPGLKFDDFLAAARRCAPLSKKQRAWIEFCCLREELDPDFDLNGYDVWLIPKEGTIEVEDRRVLFHITQARRSAPRLVQPITIVRKDSPPTEPRMELALRNLLDCCLVEFVEKRHGLASFRVKLPDGNTSPPLVRLDTEARRAIQESGPEGIEIANIMAAIAGPLLHSRERGLSWLAMREVWEGAIHGHDRVPLVSTQLLEHLSSADKDGNMVEPSRPLGFGFTTWLMNEPWKGLPPDGDSKARYSIPEQEAEQINAVLRLVAEGGDTVTSSARRARSAR